MQRPRHHHHREATTIRPEGLDERSWVAPAASAADLALIAAARDRAREAIYVTGAPGLSLAMARRGAPLWIEGFGFADVAARTPMSNRTTVRVGSFAKSYVATAVMQLVDRGALGLHDPVRRGLPDLGVVNPLGEREVTVYDLLTYRSGLAADTSDHQLVPPTDLATHLTEGYRSGVRREYNRGLPRWTAKVGERYQYSSFGFATLGLLVERVNPDGLDFPAYVQRYISEPLGLASTAFQSAGACAEGRPDLVERLCTGYARFGDVQIPSPTLYPADVPAAGLISTAADHMLFLLDFLSALRGAKASLVTPSTARLMTTPQVQIAEWLPGPNWWNGVGFELGGVRSGAFNFGHGSSQPWGWYSHCAAYPQLDLVLVMCTNCWDMTRYYNPLPDLSMGLLSSFILRRVARQAPTESHHPERSWEWKASYAMGAMMVERISGMLGAGRSLSDEQIDRMATGARPLESGRPSVWCESAFRAGVRDMLEVDPKPDAIRAFLDRGSGGITSDDLAPLGLWFGRKAELPIPMGFFAGPAEEWPPSTQSGARNRGDVGPTRGHSH